LAGELATQVRADVARRAGDEYGLHALGVLVQCSAFTLPLGARPFAISAACATVSSDWCSIAGSVRPAACGVAMTSARAARRGGERDNVIGLREQLVERLLLDRLVRIMDQHAHAERSSDAHHLLADRTIADDADGAALELFAHARRRHAAPPVVEGRACDAAR